MLPKSLVGWAVLIIIIVMVWKHPGSAANAVNAFISKVGTFFGSMGG